MPTSGSEAAGHDLRLLPLAGSLWFGLAVVLLVQPGHRTLTVGVGLGVLAVGMGAVARTSRTGWRRRHGADTGSGAVAVGRPAGPWIVAGLGLGIALGGLHVARLHPGVVAAVAADQAVVGVQARITGDPAVHWPTGDSASRRMDPTWTLAARVSRMTARGITYDLSVPVVLRGEAVRDLRFGERIVARGRAETAWAPERAAMAVTVIGEVQVRSPPGRLAAATTQIRTRFRQSTDGLPQDAAALLLGLAVGDESLVGPELDTAMVRSGLAHLTAVSGSNTALVAGIALGVAAGLGWGWRARVACSALVLAGYVALVRPQPSVLRAAGMGLVALLALSAGGRRRGPPALLAAVLVLLVGWPELGLSIGFGLSVAATAGLLVVGPPITEALGRWRASRWVPEPVRAALGVAAAAHLATLPLAVLLGNGASLVALPANVLVTPLVPVATVIGLGAALVAPVAAEPAGLMAQVAAPATGAIAWVAHTAASVPLGVVAIPGGAAPALSTALVLAACAVAVARGWRPRPGRRSLAVATALALAAAAVRLELDRRWPPPGWIVLACDVGQGDGLLVRRPGAAEALVVDVGPADGRMAQCVADAGVRPAAVLLTHFHADHVDGLADVLARWRVPILTTWVPEPPDAAAAVAVVAGSARVPIRSLRAQDALEVAGLAVAVLWPARRMAASPANNTSVVAVVRVPTGAGSTGVLLTGDIEPEAQTAVMAGPEPDVAVVKVPHHGSRHQSPGFAAWAAAPIALVSAGADNEHAHPDAGTLADYRRSGSLIGRTDEQGALAVVVTATGPGLVAQR